MQDTTRMSDITEAQNTIKVLNERLQEMAKQLSQFKIDFTVEIVQETFDIKITAVKPFGGGGVIKTVPKQIALYYKDDISSLVENVIEEFFDVLLKPILKNELTPITTRAIRNLSIMESKA